MVFAFSLASLVLGGGFACAAVRLPAQAARLETYGGTLLITGLVVLGTGLPLFR